MARTQVGIGLPRFLLEKKNHLLILCLFFLILLVLIPGAFIVYYQRQKTYAANGVLNETLQFLGHYITGETRNKNAREEMKEYVPALRKFLKNGAEPPTNVGRFLNEKWEFPEKIKKLRLGNAMAFVRLFPEEFEINANGNVRNKTAVGDAKKKVKFGVG